MNQLEMTNSVIEFAKYFQSTRKTIKEHFACVRQILAGKLVC